MQYLLLNSVGSVLGSSKANFLEPLWAKFRERSFHALERIRASRRPGFYALRMSEKRRVTLEPKRRFGYAALGVMERRLKGHDFFVGDRYSIAGNALRGYTYVAYESDFDLGRFPAVRAWLQRVAAQAVRNPLRQS